jgi:nucleoside-diphosphate-sugar epimerase
MLITGVSGFVGKRLAAYYASNGYQVHGIRHVSPSPDLNMVIETLDITDRDSVLAYFANHDFEFVIHCAGIAHQGTSAQPRREMMLVNLEGSRNIFDGAASCPGLKRVVFFSSIAVYDESQPHVETAETADCNPVGDYGHSKRLAEQDGLGRCVESGFPLVVLRFCPIYGPERLVDIEKRIRSPGGLYFLVGSGDQRLSLCSICSVVEAVDIALQRESMVGQIFNVADAQPYSRKEILQAYARALNRPGPTVRIPALLLRLLVALFSVLRPSQKRVYRSYFQKLAGEAVFDIRKIMAEGYIGAEHLERSISAQNGVERG